MPDFKKVDTNLTKTNIVDGNTKTTSTSKFRVGGFKGTVGVNHFESTHDFTIGQQSNNLGFWDSVFGDVQPRDHGSYTITNLRVDIATSDFQVAFAEGKITGVDSIEISFEGYTNGTVTFTWSISSYGTLDASLSAFFQDEESNTMGINIKNN